MVQILIFFTFLCVLICTSLPITGFLIWWNRGRKNKRKHGAGHKKGFTEKNLQIA